MLARITRVVGTSAGDATGAPDVISASSVCTARRRQQRQKSLKVLQLRLALVTGRQVPVDGGAIGGLQAIERVHPELEGERTVHGASTPDSSKASLSARSA